VHICNERLHTCSERLDTCAERLHTCAYRRTGWRVDVVGELLTDYTHMCAQWRFRPRSHDLRLKVRSKKTQMCLVEILEKSADYSLYSVNNDDGNTHIDLGGVCSQLVLHVCRDTSWHVCRDFTCCCVCKAFSSVVVVARQVNDQSMVMISIPQIRKCASMKCSEVTSQVIFCAQRSLFAFESECLCSKVIVCAEK